MTGFAFIQISDHHLGDSEWTLRKGFAPAYAMRAVLGDIAARWATRTDFIFSTGDLVLGGSAAEYAFVCQMLNLPREKHAGLPQGTATPPGPVRISAAGLRDFPMYFIPGNHDEASAFCRQLFGETVPAGQRLHLSFRHKGVHFACPDWGPEVAGHAPDTPPDMADWLAAAIHPGEPTVIVIHYAPLLVPGLWKADMVPGHIERFWQAIAGRRNVLAVLFGHTHRGFAGEHEGLPVMAVAATSYQHVLHGDEYIRALLPPEYRRVEIEGGRLTSQVYQVELPLGATYGLPAS
jgi:3',5'-cyclic AMP phosphodiesterase CpdA